MSHRHLAVLPVLILIAAACGGSSGESETAQSSSTPPLGIGPYPIAEIEIQYDHPQHSLSYQIGCQGDTATSGGDADEAGIDPFAACTALADEALRGRLFDGPPEDRVCTQVFGGQDTATVSGTIDSEDFRAVFDRSDGCAIDEWDGLAAPLLPRPYDDGSDPAPTTTTPDGDEGALGATDSCTNPEGFSIEYPSDWSVNDGTVTPACSMFDPGPFTVPAATDERVAAITAYVDAVPFANAAAPGGTVDGTRAVTAVDGHQALRLDGEFAGNQLYPDGTPVTQYLIDLSLGVDDGSGTLFVDLIGRSGVDFESARPILDAMVATIDLDPNDADPATVARYEGGGSPFTVLAGPTDTGDGICLQLANADGSSCVSVNPATDRPTLGMVTLGGDLQTILAGTTGSGVFRIEARSDGELASYLPVPVEGNEGVRAWAFPFGRDRVNELVLFDLEGNEISSFPMTSPGEEPVELIAAPNTDPVESDDFPASGRPAFLTDVRVGAHDGFDRVVFEITESDTVSYRVELTDAITQPSGEPADVDGEQFISVTLRPVSTVDLSGDEVEKIYNGPNVITPDDTTTIDQVALTSDFESTLTWGIGVDLGVEFAVGLLEQPLRLVVDVSR